MSISTTIAELTEYVGQTVTLHGWVLRNTPKGKLIFVTLRDGTGHCQCVVERGDASESFFEEAKHLTQESAIEVTGSVSAEERAIGGFEVRVTNLRTIQGAVDYPITPKPHGVDYLMKHRHLWFRSQRQHVILRIRHTLVDAIRRYFNDNGFVLIDTPIFAPAAGEGTSTLFELDYFGDPVYLAQTGQLYVETACMAHRKVYCFGPTFRAEKSKTRRHLTEFWMVEPEIAFASMDDVIDLAEDMVCSLVERVLADHRADLEFLGRDVEALERTRKPFHRISYSEAAEILRGPQAKELLEKDLAEKTAEIEELGNRIDELIETGKTAKKKWQQEKAAQQEQTARERRTELEEEVSNIPQHMELAAGFEWGSDLGGSDETIISRLHVQPVFVHRYPKEVKAFYMRVDREDDRLVENFDMLAPEGFGEVIGGSAREEDYDVLLSRIREQGLPQEPYEWYLDLRRYGSVPHGGFGLGVERTLGWLCGLKHVRETIPFPRMMGKFYP
ncbi:MAG: asparagine--tRNA ligase [bacterium]|nr:asparagine--tRNA ligase [bacterium]